jgi:hypothetical protein
MELSVRTTEDQVALRSRCSRVDPIQVKCLEEYFIGMRIRKSRMKAISDEILRHYPTIEQPDRLAYRNRRAFVIWFVKNWNIAYPFI